MLRAVFTSAFARPALQQYTASARPNATGNRPITRRVEATHRDSLRLNVVKVFNIRDATDKYRWWQ
jgi:hypothetical protein